MTSTARVTALWTYPVKSMAGSSHPSAEVGPAGLAGDRTWCVRTTDGEVLSARQAPGLADVEVSLDEAGHLMVRIPGAAPDLIGDAAAAALSSYLGRAVRLAPVTDGCRQGAAVHLVSRQALAAIGTASHDPAGDRSAPRANLTVDLGEDWGEDDGEKIGEDSVGELERAWVGRELVVGAAVLLVDRVPKHCLGVYAEVRTPGRINVGDSVRLRG